MRYSILMLLACLSFSVFAATTAPATAPARAATTQQTTEAYLRGLIRNLQEQIAALKDENTSLKRQVADLSAQVPKQKQQKSHGPPVVDADKMDDLVKNVKVGMSREDLLDLMVRKPDREATHSDNTEVLMWTFLSYEGRMVNSHEVVRQGYPSASLTVELTDGRVSAFRKSKG